MLNIGQWHCGSRQEGGPELEIPLEEAKEAQGREECNYKVPSNN